MVRKSVILVLMILVLTSLINCDDKAMYPIKTYEDTIFRLKAENDQLRDQLEKCSNWVDFLESEDEYPKEE